MIANTYMFCAMTILVIFEGFEHKTARIDPIGLKIGLLINLDLNDEQNKNQVHMY